MYLYKDILLFFRVFLILYRVGFHLVYKSLLPVCAHSSDLLCVTPVVGGSPDDASCEPREPKRVESSVLYPDRGLRTDSIATILSCYPLVVRALRLLRVFAGTPVEEETPAPAASPSPVIGNGVEDEGGDEGVSTVTIVGVIAGVLATLGGGALALKCGCKDINVNCFNRH